MELAVFIAEALPQALTALLLSSTAWSYVAFFSRGRTLVALRPKIVCSVCLGNPSFAAFLAGVTFTL